MGEGGVRPFCAFVAALQKMFRICGGRSYLPRQSKMDKFVEKIADTYDVSRGMRRVWGRGEGVGRAVKAGASEVAECSICVATSGCASECTSPCGCLHAHLLAVVGAQGPGCAARQLVEAQASNRRLLCMSCVCVSVCVCVCVCCYCIVEAKGRTLMAFVTLLMCIRFVTLSIRIHS